MPRKTKPEPDDGPAAYKTTPRRLSTSLRGLAGEAAELALRVRELEPLIAGSTIADAANDLIAVCQTLSAVSVRVLIGRTAIVAEFTDPKYQPDRPLLDAIEAKPVRRVAEAIAERVGERGDTAPGWEADGDVPPSIRLSDAGGSWSRCGRCGGDEAHPRGMGGMPCHWDRATVLDADDPDRIDRRHETPRNGPSIPVAPSPGDPPHVGAARSAAKKRAKGKAAKASNGTIAGDAWTDEHTAKLRDALGAIPAATRAADVRVAKAAANAAKTKGATP